MRRALLLWLLPLFAPALPLAACSGQSVDEGEPATRPGVTPKGPSSSKEEEPSGSPSNVAQNGKANSEKTFWGDDRVGAMLQGKPTQIPSELKEFEALFKVGRQCARASSKEIFVVEEAQSRAGGSEATTHTLLPRSVMTGCDTTNNTLRNSFSLMVALISTDDPTMPAGDPIITAPLEVMALDNTTGVYNFYDFNPTGDKLSPEKVRRFVKLTDGSVRKFTLKVSGIGAKPSVVMTNELMNDDGDTKRCFNCHPNGGPLMNEMSLPWTNWISQRKPAPKEANLEGTSLELVKEAAGDESLDESERRGSLANDLEKIIKAGISTYVRGTTTSAGVGTGFLEGTLDGTTYGGGLSYLLRSVFCQTELNYLSAGDIVPYELFIDPTFQQDLENIGVVPPTPEDAENPFPFLLPIRSEFDKRVEAQLRTKGYLSSNTILAIRLIDDEKDIFSSSRCGAPAKGQSPATGLYYGEIVKIPEILRVPKLKADKGEAVKPADVDAKIREILRAKVSRKDWQPKRSDYFLKLIANPPISDDELEESKNAYLEELKERFEFMTEDLQSVPGILRLQKRDNDRKAAARQMFSGVFSPIPLLE